jgi:hypothetical protein
MLAADGLVQRWLCREIKESARLCKDVTQDGAAASHARDEGKHVLLYAAARLCMQAARASDAEEGPVASCEEEVGAEVEAEDGEVVGEEGEEEGKEEEEGDVGEWSARRQVLLRLVGRGATREQCSTRQSLPVGQRCIRQVHCNGARAVRRI